MNERVRRPAGGAAPPRAAGTYRACRVSALALVKMADAAARGGAQEVMGMLLGDVDGDTFLVRDAFALPVEATETRVNAMGEAYEYIVRYLDCVHMAGGRNKVVGWYHSHPGYGCFLSRIDIGTQFQNQQFQDPFVAIVVDPVESARRQRVEIGAFRTTSATDYYELDVSYAATPLDSSLVSVLDAESWVRTLARALD